MKIAYHILTNLLGVGCIAACIAIVATMGALDIHWSGWIGVGYFAMLVLGILAGWFPWRGRPLQVMVKGFYVMSALALIGFGFAMDDPMRVHLWMVGAAIGAAIVLRIILKVIFHLRDEGDNEPVRQEPAKAATNDPFLN
jgi:peptidoglycan/LPS O-acetylase OafA/YrhL